MIKEIGMLMVITGGLLIPITALVIIYDAIKIFSRTNPALILIFVSILLCFVGFIIISFSGGIVCKP